MKRPGLYYFCGLIAGLILGLGGCSPGIFGDGKDQGVKDLTNYRETSCDGLDLSSQSLKSKDIRLLLNCLNSNGSIQPVVDLTAKLSDAELQPFVEFGNHLLVENRNRMHAINESALLLDRVGYLDPLFKQLSRVLTNTDFFTSAIQLLKEAYKKENRPDLLKSAEKIGQELNSKNVEIALGAGLALARAPSVKEVSARLKGISPSARSLQFITTQLIGFIRDSREPSVELDFLKELLIVIKEGTLFQVLDETLGSNPDEMKDLVSEQANVLKVLGQSNNGQDSELLWGVTTFMQGVHTPVICLKGAKTLPAGSWHAIEELALSKGDPKEFIRRYQVIQKQLMTPFCDVPAAMQLYYPWLIKFAETSAINPATHLIKTTYKYNLAKIVSQFLAFGGEDTGVQRLIPIVGELTDRGIWEDALLAGQLLKPEDRHYAKSIAEFALEPLNTQSGRSMFDVVGDSLARANRIHLYNFLKSLGKFIDDDEPFVEPIIGQLRSAYYVNSVHPLTDLFAEFLSHATQYEDLFTVILKASEFKEFNRSLELFGEMSKDGRLKDLMLSVLKIFSPKSDGLEKFPQTPEPALESRVRHNLSSKDLNLKAIVITPWDDKDPCHQVNFNIRIDNYEDPRWADNLKFYLSCLNEKGTQNDVVDTFNLLLQTHTSSGKTFFGFLVDWIRDFNFDREAVRDLVNRQFAWLDDGRFDRGTRLFDYWIPVLRPLWHTFGSLLSQAEAELQALLTLGGEIIDRPDIPQVLKYLETINDREAQPIADPIASESPELIEQVRRAVRNRECITDPVQIESRVSEIFNDFYTASNTWELKNGQVRKEWQLGEFKAEIEPLLQKIADPAQSYPKKRVLDALLRVTNYFDTDSEADGVVGPDRPKNSDRHFTREYLAKYLSERAVDRHVIVYFYLGDYKPRVRVVNSLDMLELVLMNADFTYLVPDNYGLKFVAMLGKAWADDPMDVRPPEIQKLGNKVGTLGDAVHAMKKQLNLTGGLAGYPKMQGHVDQKHPGFPKCTQGPDDGLDLKSGGGLPLVNIAFEVRARLFNISQVIKVLDWDTPNNNGSNPHPHAGGLRVLRDLFWELYESTPENFRNERAGWNNNLSVVTKMVRLGLMRQIGMKLLNDPILDPEHPLLENQWRRAEISRFNALIDFYKGFVVGAASPEVNSMLNPLLVDDRTHALIWSLIKTSFEMIEKDPQSMTQMRTALMYIIAQAPSMKVIDPFLRNATQILKSEGKYLTDRSTKVHDLFTDKKVSEAAQKLYEDRDQDNKDKLAEIARYALSQPDTLRRALTLVKVLDTDPVAHPYWEDFDAKRKQLADDPAYQALRPEDMGKDALHFFEETMPNTANQVRHVVATSLKPKSGRTRSDVNEILWLAGNKPEEFNQTLEMISRKMKSGDVREFIEMARRSVVDSNLP